MPSLAFAEDFKTISGKEYKNVAISRVETDGIVLKNKSGITKVYFTELPSDVQKRFQQDSGGRTKGRWQAKRSVRRASSWGNGCSIRRLVWCTR